MELIIPINSKSKVPLYEQIYLYIKKEIVSKKLKPMDRIPSVRKLSDYLKISRSTVQLAYEQLSDEGYIESVPYKGYYVARLEELINVQSPFLSADDSEYKEEFLPNPYRNNQTEEKYSVDFSPRGIDLDSFPYSVWRKITKDVLVDDNRELFLSGTTQGERPLRNAIANYLHTARGVECDADQIIIGAGNEYLLMLLQHILGNRRCVAMENPTYKQAYRVFTSLGYDIVPIRMDSYGMRVEDLKHSNADIAYIMPSHQFPTGIIMPVKRRQELLSWVAEEKNRYIIEDDYDSEFRYRGRPIPALQGMDRNDKVIYMGTFSKSVAPAIRVGYMVLPKKLMKIYYEKTSFFSSTVSRIDQNVLYRFLVDGHYERHLNRMRSIYKDKHDVLLNECRILDGTFQMYGENAGLHILLKDKKNRPEEWLIKTAADAGIKVYGFSNYFIDCERNYKESTIVLGYANLSIEKIRLGISTLAEVMK